MGAPARPPPLKTRFGASKTSVVETACFAYVPCNLSDFRAGSYLRMQKCNETCGFGRRLPSRPGKTHKKQCFRRLRPYKLSNSVCFDKAFRGYMPKSPLKRSKNHSFHPLQQIMFVSIRSFRGYVSENLLKRC